MILVLIYLQCVGRPGLNTIRRRSTESNLTVPFKRTFQDLDDIPPLGTDDRDEFVFCGCGWPQHMLIPKGTPEGLDCELFVMLSNYMDDRVDQDLVGTCNDAFSFCGVRNRLYPDRKPMGYPFDRRPRDGVDTLKDFLTPNMYVTNVVIYNNDIYPKSTGATTASKKLPVDKVSDVENYVEAVKMDSISPVAPVEPLEPKDPGSQTANPADPKPTDPKPTVPEPIEPESADSESLDEE